MAPCLVAAIGRVRRGDTDAAPVRVDPDLGYAGSYLHMLTGTRPSAEKARALDQYLISTIDHGFNASTFTARVIASTGSDMGSAMVEEGTHSELIARGSTYARLAALQFTV